MNTAAHGQVKLLIVSGASAGHLYPALAFAQRMHEEKKNLRIAFVSSRRGELGKSIAEDGFGLFLISVLPFSFKSFKKFLQTLYHFIKSLLESFFIIEKFRPDVVIGFGSYVSFPVLFEAALFKKNTIIHEQNVSLGLANKALSFFVDKVAVSFRQTEGSCCRPRPFCHKVISWGWKGRGKSVFTGNPLRQSLIKARKEDARRFFNLEDKFTILTLGGSQGSYAINMAFKRCVQTLEGKEDFQFIHLSGKNDYNDLKKSYNYTKIKHCVFDFLKEMHLAYGLADLVISRAGATTIAELAYFQKAAILIPYPYAQGHQLENALAIEKENAAVVIEEAELAGDKLCEDIVRLIHVDSQRKCLERNIQKFYVSDAAGSLVDLALSLVKV